MSRIAPLAFALFLPLPVPSHAADPVPANKQYLEFIRGEAAGLRAKDQPPATAEEWKAQEASLRKRLLTAWGGFPETPFPLDPRTHGEALVREGYKVEKITFQTHPGVRMTANLYVPDAAGKGKKLPAILMVHGHWKGAKQDPTVQARCIGAAKLGFVVLCVDAFGAGERGVGAALGEYHGDMTAATLLPLGTPLSGMQVYENMRAVDYLLTRPEVDGERLGITGASGGGNQTMYAGAWDKRFKCVVPVCSVGNYQAYLGPACCMCEVVPGALRFTEEWAVLAMVAPRALMVVNATKDSTQFSVGEARKSLAMAAPVFRLLGNSENLRHAIFESPHDYSKAMREAMYGFMTLHLKGEGDGSPIPEPAIEPEKPDDLLCFPGHTRPNNFMTIPKYAAMRGKEILAAHAKTGWFELPGAQRSNLKAVLGLEAWDSRSGLKIRDGSGISHLTVKSEPGLDLNVTVEAGSGPYILLLNLDGEEAARKGKLYSALKKTNATVVTCDLRGTGKLALPGEKVGRALDHHSAEWGLWVGRPLVAQWLIDIQTGLLPQSDLMKHKGGDGRVIVIGEGPAGLVAILAAVFDPRITDVVAVDSSVSFISNTPYANQRLGTIVPGILRDVGDVPNIAALVQSQHLFIAGGVSGNGDTLTQDELKAAFDSTLSASRNKGQQFSTIPSSEILDFLPLRGVAAEDKSDRPIFEPGAKLTVLVGDGAAGEGPAWDPHLGVLTCGAKGIHQLTPDGMKLVFRDKIDPNGLQFDREGRIVCCDQGQRRMVRIDRDGKLTVLTDNFNGRKYNSPNDLTIDTKNRIYFSDPRYGPKIDMQIRDGQGNTVEGVYRMDPDGKVSRVIGREVERANGVLVSPDDKYLFVADNNNDALGGARKLFRFDLKPDGSVDLKSRKLLYDWGKGRGPDGLKQDAAGRLYVAAGLNKPSLPAEPATDVKGGIYVIDPESGKLLAFQGVPTDEVTNCAFGGSDRKTLYITGGGTLYSIRTTTPGVLVWPPK